MSKQIELIKKLAELAKRGIGGEKANAEAMLAKLMKKHGISWEEIEEDTPDFVIMDILPGVMLSRLFQQVVSAVMPVGQNSVYGLKGRKNKRAVNCTKSQALEIEFQYAIYSKAYQKEEGIFYSAFVQANKIFNPDGQKRDLDDLSPEELAEVQKIMERAALIDPVSKRKQLMNKS